MVWKSALVYFQNVWMSVNLLKINTDKIEFIMFGAPSYVSRYGDISVRVGNDDIKVTRSVQNLGFQMNFTMNNKDNVAQICRSSCLTLRNISRIKFSVNTAKNSSSISIHKED